jgi:hypothetical protein
MKIIYSMIIGLFLSSSAMGAPESILLAWEGFSSPDIMAQGYITNIKTLPVEGATDFDGPKFWSGPYWPDKTSGINVRWNALDPELFSYKKYTKEELQTLSEEKLEELSPSEKYDIYMGRYDYPLNTLVSKEVSETDPAWEGICNGWVIAALNHNEPTPKTLKNPDGISVPFGSTDIKGIISYYYARSESHVDFVGLRCNFGDWTGGSEGCDEDLNAGAFHIILTNKIGLKKEGFVLDVERWDQVWNQPVIGYSTSFSDPSSKEDITPTAARGTDYQVIATTVVYFVTEAGGHWDIIEGTDYQTYGSKTYQYILELNEAHEIIGGEWVSEQRPDFMWQMPKETKFKGLYKGLPALLND